jgi:FkbM family methyltransferase
MLISLELLAQKFNLKIKGILHVGAHECEEKEVYDKIGVKDVVWVEGNEKIYEKMKTIYPNEKIYNALISDKDGEMVDFIITNNGQSSSILELEEHKIQHPHIHEVERRKVSTTTIKTLFTEHKLNFENYNFLNCDTQGAELMVLKSMGDALQKFDYLYLEVNIKHLYTGCPLLGEITEYVKSFGFEMVELQMTEHFWGDAFFIRK